jgi:hypothetical protein
MKSEKRGLCKFLNLCSPAFYALIKAVHCATNGEHGGNEDEKAAEEGSNGP